MSKYLVSQLEYLLIRTKCCDYAFDSALRLRHRRPAARAGPVALTTPPGRAMRAPCARSLKGRGRACGRGRPEDHYGRPIKGKPWSRGRPGSRPRARKSHPSPTPGGAGWPASRHQQVPPGPSSGLGNPDEVYNRYIPCIYHVYTMYIPRSGIYLVYSM